MNIEIENLNDDKIKDRGIYSWPIWSCEISEFNWEYGEEESCLLIEGSVEVKTDFETVHFSKGDYVVFPKGLKCRWKVTRPVQKHYSFS